MTARFKITDAVRVRHQALDVVLRAAATIKGWEMKTGGELLSEAELVEHWLKSGTRKIPAKAKR